jgi:hypothetical protein
MHSRSFVRWLSAHRECAETERRYYAAVIDAARGLGPDPSAELLLELQFAQTRARKLLHALVGDLSCPAASSYQADTRLAVTGTENAASQLT